MIFHKEYKKNNIIHMMICIQKKRENKLRNIERIYEKSRLKEKRKISKKEKNKNKFGLKSNKK